MKSKIKASLALALTVITLGAFAPLANAAQTRTADANVQTFGSCYGGGYGGGYYRPSYRDTCKLIHTCYFNRGCKRFVKKTFLHHRYDHCGRLIKCWKTYKTICIGSHYRY